MENRTAAIGLLVAFMFILGTFPVHAQGISKNPDLAAKAAHVKAFVKQKVSSLKTSLQGKLSSIKISRPVSRQPIPISVISKKR